MDRRKFLGKAGATLAASAAVTLTKAPNVIAQPKFQWRLVTSWPPSFEILNGTAQRFARQVDEMSGGRLKIQMYTAGELIPPLGVFDAVSNGSIDAYSSGPYFWAGKEPAMQWFCAVPFGLNAQGMYSWFYQGGGLKLMEEAYQPFNLVPRPGGGTGAQMGGWFRKKINTTADFKGVKMRIPGLGGKVLAKAGLTVVLIAPGEVYTALERGTIDATELVAPHDDLKQGYHRVARYYYYPGWHEAGTTVEITFSRKAYEGLPVDLQRIVDYSVMTTNVSMLGEYEVKNALGLARLRTEFKTNVEVLPFPAEVVKELRAFAADTNREESEKTPIAKKVYESYMKFQDLIRDWGRISEGVYYNQIVG